MSKKRNCLFAPQCENTGRGFRIYNFVDNNGYSCSIQKRSSAMEDAIWLGLNDACPKALHGDATKLGIVHDKTCGWVDVKLPKEIDLTTRMHLTREQAKDLGRMLLIFAESGELPKVSY